jgi:hypothetical protein
MNSLTSSSFISKQRWWQFSLRKLLGAITVACCVFAWFAYERREAAAARAAFAPLVKAVAHYGHLDEASFDWRRYLFGENPQRTVDVICLEGMSFEDHDLKPLEEFQVLRCLRLTHTNISDASVLHLEKLKGVKSLNIRCTHITPSGAARLKLALPQCQVSTSFDEDEDE